MNQPADFDAGLIENMVYSIVEKFYSQDSPMGRVLNQDRSVEKEDLVQEAWVAAITAANRFQGKNGAKFSSYAYTTIIGHLLHYIRDYVDTTDKLDLWGDNDEDDDGVLEAALPSHEPGPELIAQLDEQLVRVLSAMDALDEDMQQVLYAHFVFDVPIPELAEAAGISRHTLYSRIQRALNTVRVVYHERASRLNTQDGGGSS